MKLTHTGLKPRGRLITIDPCLTPRQNLLARFMIAHDRGQNIRDAVSYRALPSSLFLQLRAPSCTDTGGLPTPIG